MARRPTLGVALKTLIDKAIWAQVQTAAMTSITDLLEALEDSVKVGMEDLINEAFTTINSTEPESRWDWPALSKSWDDEKVYRWGGERQSFWKGKNYLKKKPSLHSTFKDLDNESERSGNKLYHALGGITYTMGQPNVLNAGFELRSHYVNDVNRALKNPYFINKATGKRATQEAAVNLRRLESAPSAPGVGRTENPYLRRYQGRNVGVARQLSEGLIGTKVKVETFTLFSHIKNMGGISKSSNLVLETLDANDTSLLGKRRTADRSGPASAADKLYIGAHTHKRQLLDALLKQYLDQDITNNVEAALRDYRRRRGN